MSTPPEWGCRNGRSLASLNERTHNSQPLLLTRSTQTDDQLSSFLPLPSSLSLSLSSSSPCLHLCSPLSCLSPSLSVSSSKVSQCLGELKSLHFPASRPNLTTPFSTSHLVLSS